MKPYYYLLINIACISIPFIASFYPKHAFYKKWGSFFKASIPVALFFIIWDYWFTAIGVWGFNKSYLTGLFLGELPIEEILFFIAIPYACVFTYFALLHLVKNNPLQKAEKYITFILTVVSILIAVLFYNKLYTFTTAVLGAVFLSYLSYKKINLSYHYLTYLLIIPFFMASNGILTGSFLESPIVWYNNAETIGFRMGTIPVEDSFYGLILIFMNIELFRFFNKKKQLNA
ncbi:MULTISPECIES: lycopene cyclase domain-containing protein [unclassified Cellulophaga]|uniref:lycopene cyclase domain-containing protein n=1 Tax=unclassified Cellulophaga TaxID=2634405 RepID=UPI000C2C84E3|nr:MULTISPECIES: lycopene cyclase domain-containing protein [unclassified Cellulophaga]MDO6492666.1 lycopene cyclase domain-containing protein [Cellulophaga sp. 2_MG-2023]MDO6495923.1 lycopene cyclase domain-containing protein [Cellulophaga sp. 3_MG-2023]PKB43509.1 lycopene cyclase domain-containing protein [Cellulophaga sp. RHA19]